MFLSSAVVFLNLFFGNTIKMSNILDLDQARPFVWPDLDPNCLKILSTDVTSRLIDVLYFSVCWSPTNIRDPLREGWSAGVSIRSKPGLGELWL